MTSDEGMMNAARVMRDAAETNQRTAARIEEAVGQMQIIFDASYGGTAPRLLEELEKANAEREVRTCARQPMGKRYYIPARIDDGTVLLDCRIAVKRKDDCNELNPGWHWLCIEATTEDGAVMVRQIKEAANG